MKIVDDTRQGAGDIYIKKKVRLYNRGFNCGVSGRTLGVGMLRGRSDPLQYVGIDPVGRE